MAGDLMIVAKPLLAAIAKKLGWSAVQGAIGPSARDLFAATQEQAHADTLQIVYMVAKALLAERVGRDPLAADIDTFLATALGGSEGAFNAIHVPRHHLGNVEAAVFRR